LGSASADYAYSPASGKETTQTFHFAMSGKSETDYYAYDATGRLATATINGLTTIYTYDPDTGALHTSKAGSAATCTLSYETTNALNWTGHLVSAGSMFYRTDANGHRTAAGPANNPTQTTYTWSGDRLVHLAGPSGVATYTYDASGQRTGSIITSGSLVTTTAYDYDDTTLLGLSSTRTDGANWKIRYVYDSEGKPFAGVYRSDTISATPFLIETSDRGDVRELLASNGASFALFSYDSYGMPTSTVTAAAGSLTTTQAAEVSGRQPIRYAGYAFDIESGLYYCSARYYDPRVNAFVSKDSAKADGEESAYQYTGGDPVNSTDPTGAKKKKKKKSIDKTEDDPIPAQEFLNVRNAIVRWAKKLVKWKLTYSNTNYKFAKNGRADCSSAADYIFQKANLKFVKGWNSTDYYRRPKQREKFHEWGFAKGDPWSIGDVLVTPIGSGANHVVVVVSDGKNPSVFECTGSSDHKPGLPHGGTRIVTMATRIHGKVGSHYWGSPWTPKRAVRLFRMYP